MPLKFLNTEIAGIRPPDTRIVREAAELVFEVSRPALFNHVMRSYYFGRLIRQGRARNEHDDELVFLAAVLHDLGLTRLGRGPRRFEVEGAEAAANFLREKQYQELGVRRIWDAIALHTTDLNPYRGEEEHMLQAGVVADVQGIGIERIEPSSLEEVVKAFPRLHFNEVFFDLLHQETIDKPHSHFFHPTYVIACNCHGPVPIPDFRAMIGASPFGE